MTTTAKQSAIIPIRTMVQMDTTTVGDIVRDNIGQLWELTDRGWYLRPRPALGASPRTSINLFRLARPLFKVAGK